MDLERQCAELVLFSGEDDVRTASSGQRENETRRRRGAEPAERALQKSANGTAK